MNYEKEVYLADVMSANISKGPLELGVPQRLCMEDQVCALILCSLLVICSRDSFQNFFCAMERN